MAPPREPPTTILPSPCTTIGQAVLDVAEDQVPSAAVPTWSPVPLKLGSSWPSASAAAGAARARARDRQGEGASAPESPSMNRVRHEWLPGAAVDWGLAPSVAGAGLAPPTRGVYHSQLAVGCQLDVRLGQPVAWTAEARRRAGIARVARPARTRCARTGATRRSTAGSPRARRRRARARGRPGAARAGSRARRARARPDPSARRSRPGRPRRVRAPSGARREVAQLERIGREVVEQVGVARAADVLVRARAGSSPRAPGRPRPGTRPAPRPGPAELPVSAPARLRALEVRARRRLRRPARRAWGRGRAARPARATRRAARPGPRTISGTRAEPSRNDILYQRPALAEQLAVVGREDDERVCRRARSRRAQRAPRRRARRGS